MSLLVDTSVWSHALRRDEPQDNPETQRLEEALTTGSVFTTGLILQELLQGFAGPKASRRILERFSALPFVVPQREDHIKAAQLRNACRRKGVQVTTVDALLAQICIRHRLTMLTLDADFRAIARFHPLRIWHQA